MNDAEPFDAAPQGPWSRFARAFDARAGSRWAWRALLLCIGLAVLAPWLANERPYFVSLRDAQGYREALALLEPVSRGFVRETLAAQAAGGAVARARSAAERRALEHALASVERGLGGESAALPARDALAAIRASLREFEAAAGAGDAAAIAAGAVRLQDSIASASRPLALRSAQEPAGVELVAQRSWPLLAALSAADLIALCLWLGLVGWGTWTRCLPRRTLLARGLFLLLASAALGGCLALALPKPPTQVGESWAARVAADPHSRAVFAPIAFGPNQTDLQAATQAPSWGASAAEHGRHWCGTDALGRDQLARLLHAGRTSFSVALLASALILGIGAALGLCAGALRGFADFAVSRLIELLQAFPTLVLLLGLISLLPSSAANSRWTVPLVIAAIGWTHIARLARAQALRVRESDFVRAALAAGFSPARVLWFHVLPNSLGPVWVAASFVLSAGLVLESSAAFLGFGVQHPAPSWGGLLAQARGGDAWWLALFPGLWLFAAILCIHLVGEGVRDALDPRDETRAP